MISICIFQEKLSNTLTLTINFGIKNVTVPNDSQIPMNVLNHSTLSGVALMYLPQCLNK